MIATKRSSLLAECLFWGADSVALMITGETNPMHLRPEDRSIREEEMAARDGTSLLEDALGVDVRGRLPEDLQLPLLFRAEEQPAPNPCESLMDFERRFSKICGSAAEAIMRVPNIVFAGGAVLSAFLGEGSFTPRPQTKKGLTALATVDARERVVLSDKKTVTSTPLSFPTMSPRESGACVSCSRHYKAHRASTGCSWFGAIRR